MGLKDKLIAKEEGREEHPTQEEAQENENFDLPDFDLLNTDASDKEIPADNLIDDEVSTVLDFLEDETLENASEATSLEEALDDLKTDNKSEEEDVCPKCGGKRRRNGNYYHLKTCEDYKINGEYPNRKNQVGEPDLENIDLNEPDEVLTNTSVCSNELEQKLADLAKHVILEDIKSNYTSKLLTPDALNTLIDSYLNDNTTSITHKNQVFSAVLDEIITSNYTEAHYGDLTILVLEAIKAEL